MPTTDRKLRVFLCHSSQDKPIVRDLYQRLNAEGWIDPWLDEERLLPGQDWEVEIKKAIQIADIVLVLLSTKSINKKGYIQKELKFALDVALEQPEESIFIIPLRLEECEVPERLNKWQWLNLFPDKSKSIATLLKSLSVRANQLDIKTTLTYPLRQFFTISPEGQDLKLFRVLEKTRERLAGVKLLFVVDIYASELVAYFPLQTNYADEMANKVYGLAVNQFTLDNTLIDSSQEYELVLQQNGLIIFAKKISLNLLLFIVGDDDFKTGFAKRLVEIWIKDEVRK